jgi:hypothetical protein
MATNERAIVGVSDHGGWAVLVTVGRDAKLIDRRRVELVEKGLPAIPHHVQAQSLPVDEAVALVERVRGSAEACSHQRLDELAASVSVPIVAIALRECPPLPATVAERISNYRAQNVADWVMYREALAQAAEARRWTVHWYDARYVLGEAQKALGGRDIHDHLRATGSELGPPWQKDHRLAMAAAIAASVG